MLTKLLQNYDFSEKEAKIYLTALEIGSAPASSIARRANENRVTTYSILKSLCKKGYAYHIKKEQNTYYGVIEPNLIFEKQEKKLKKLSQAMPELMALANMGSNKPTVQIYEGLEGLKKAFEDALRTQKTTPDECFYVFTGAGEVNKEFENYLLQEFQQLRKKCQTKSKMLIAKDHYCFSGMNKEQKDVRFVNENIFGSRNQVILFGTNKVGVYIYSNHELFAITIESAIFYQGFKSLFLHIRKQST